MNTSLLRNWHRRHVHQEELLLKFAHLLHHNRFHLQDSPYLFIYWESFLCLSPTNKSNPSIWSFSSTLWRDGWEEHQFSNWCDVEETEMAEARIVVHRQSVPSSQRYSFRSQRPPAKAVLTAVFLCPSHLLPTSSFLKVWTQTNTMATTPEESHCSCSFWDNSLIPLGSLLPRSKYLFFFFFEAFMKKNG